MRPPFDLIAIDDRFRFQGTALDVLGIMRDKAFRPAGESIPEYVLWLGCNLGIDFTLEDPPTESWASEVLNIMIGKGLLVAGPPEGKP